MQRYSKTMSQILREMNEATVSVYDISYADVPKSKLTQAAKKFRIKMKNLPRNQVRMGGDAAAQFTGSDSDLLKFAKQQFGTTARNIRDLKKELEEQEDPEQKAKEKIDKIQKIAALKKQIQDIQKSENSEIDEGKMSQMHMMIKQKKTPEQIARALKLDLKTVKALMKEAVDPQDTGGAAEVDMIMNQVNQMRHFLDGIEKMISDDGDVEEWVQGKITKATDYLKTAYSYKTGEEQKESIDLEEFKKMVVTIKDPSKRRKAMDDIKRFGKRTGFRIDKMRDGKSFKIDGKGADLNKFATDLKNYYGAEIKAESYEPLEEFTDKQIERLRKEYMPLKGKETGIDPAKFRKLRGMMKRFPKANLLKLVKADIPVLTTGAKAALVMYHGMQWKQLPEDFLPYIELFTEEVDEQKGKFKEVDPKVYARIAKMMKGSKEEKQGLANMLNYLMPPEVVDMVRDKFGIKTPRGKIKFTDL